MQMFSGHGGFETQDVPKVWRPHHQLPEEKTFAALRSFYAKIVSRLAHEPEQQPNTGHVGAVPRNPRRVHGWWCAYRL